MGDPAQATERLPKDSAVAKGVNLGRKRAAQTRQPTEAYTDDEAETQGGAARRERHARRRHDIAPCVSGAQGKR